VYKCSEGKKVKYDLISKKKHFVEEVELLANKIVYLVIFFAFLKMQTIPYSLSPSQVGVRFSEGLALLQ
jgi:hypothetical protein